MAQWSRNGVVGVPGQFMPFLESFDHSDLKRFSFCDAAIGLTLFQYQQLEAFGETSGSITLSNSKIKNTHLKPQLKQAAVKRFIVAIKFQSQLKIHHCQEIQKLTVMIQSRLLSLQGN